MEVLLYLGYIGLKFLEFSVTDFGYAAVVSVTLGVIGLNLELLYALLVLLNLLDKSLLGLPFFADGLFLLLELFDFGVQLFEL